MAKTPATPFTVVVSDHAREQARERFPGFKTARIIDEVREALRDGRMSTHPPVESLISLRERKRSLYVWSEDGAHVYALRSGDNCFFVQTALNGVAKKEGGRKCQR